jgi:hypothetical protein
MSVKVTIDDRGIVQEKGSGFTFSSPTPPVGMSPGRLNVNTVGPGPLTCSCPGFYYISGSGLTTASIIGPGSWPGAMLVFTNTDPSWVAILSCSAAVTNRPAFITPVVTYASGNTCFIQTGSLIGGPCMVLYPTSSVAMISSGYSWMIMTCSGSVSMSLTSLP